VEGCRAVAGGSIATHATVWQPKISVTSSDKQRQAATWQGWAPCSDKRPRGAAQRIGGSQSPDRTTSTRLCPGPILAAAGCCWLLLAAPGCSCDGRAKQRPAKPEPPRPAGAKIAADPKSREKARLTMAALCDWPMPGRRPLTGAIK
jgi:hypothetical protein